MCVCVCVCVGALILSTVTLVSLRGGHIDTDSEPIRTLATFQTVNLSICAEIYTLEAMAFKFTSLEIMLLADKFQGRKALSDYYAVLSEQKEIKSLTPSATATDNFAQIVER